VDVDKIAVMLINVGDKQTSNVRLNNDPIDGNCRVNIDVGVPVTVAQAIGGQTTLVLVFNRQGKLTKRITYADGSSPNEEIFDP